MRVRIYTYVYVPSNCKYVKVRESSLSHLIELPMRKLVFLPHFVLLRVPMRQHGVEVVLRHHKPSRVHSAGRHTYFEQHTRTHYDRYLHIRTRAYTLRQVLTHTYTRVHITTGTYTLLQVHTHTY